MTFHTHDTFRPYRPRPDAASPLEPGTVPDSAAATGNDAEVAATFADAYRMLNNPIGIFINLPFASLDKLTLQKRLDESAGRKPDESA